MADVAQRFFCHQCSAEIPTIAADFTCPTCNSGKTCPAQLCRLTLTLFCSLSGFIEELAAGEGPGGGAGVGAGGLQGVDFMYSQLDISQDAELSNGQTILFQMGHVPYTLWECIYLRSQECIERDKRGGNRQCIEFIVTRASCGRVVSRFDLICGDGRITGDGGQL